MDEPPRERLKLSLKLSLGSASGGGGGGGGGGVGVGGMGSGMGSGTGSDELNSFVRKPDKKKKKLGDTVVSGTVAGAGMGIEQAGLSAPSLSAGGKTGAGKKTVQRGTQRRTVACGDSFEGELGLGFARSGEYSVLFTQY